MPRFDKRGFKINYIEEGTGPAVVFAHGFEMDHHMYEPQFEDLPDNGYRCIAWDMRGHGRSDTPDGPWTMYDLVVDLIRFIEETNAAPCHLVGMSIGGMIAVRVALQREDLVRSLVLIDTTADAEDAERVELYKAFQQQIIDEDGVSEDLARGTLPIFYGPNYLETELEAVEFHVSRMTGYKATASVEGLRALIERDSVVDRLDEIRVPTLVIHGAVDAAIGMEKAEQLQAGIAGAELIRVPDCGHTPPLEAPDVVNQALAGFLARVKR